MAKAKDIALAALFGLTSVSCSNSTTQIPHNSYIAERLAKAEVFEERITKHLQESIDDVLTHSGLNGGYSFDEVPSPKINIEFYPVNEKMFYLESPFYFHEGRIHTPKISVLELSISKSLKNRKLESLVKDFGVKSVELKTSIDDDFINIALSYQMDQYDGLSPQMYEITFPKLSKIGSIYKAAQSYVDELAKGYHITKDDLARIEAKYGVMLAVLPRQSLNLSGPIEFSLVVVGDKQSVPHARKLMLMFAVQNKENII